MSDRPSPALPAPGQPKLLPAPDGAKPADRRRHPVAAVVAIVVLATLLAVGWFFHHRQATQAKEDNDRARDRLPGVDVIDVKASPPTSDLRLPATISALTEASLFARSSGYLTVRYVDIGDTVRRGQVMAEIDSPDLDQQVAMARQQLAQARSGVDDAKARVDLSRVTYARLSALGTEQAVSQQQVDQGQQDLATARANVSSSAANVGALEANLRRLVILQGYEKLRAPFDGIVTARNVDVGALVNGSGGNAAASGGTTSGSGSSAGSSATTSGGSGNTAQPQNSTGTPPTELFRIAQADRVRVFVTVPQESAASVEPDSEANVFVAGFDAPLAGRVTRTARALDPSARTLLTEVQVANPQHRLVPGMFAQVGFRSPRRGAPMLVPGEAVVARAEGLSVAVLEDLRPEDRDRLPKSGTASSGEHEGKESGDAKAGADQRDRQDRDDDPGHARRIHLQKVAVGRDYGTEIEITRGLKEGMTIVAHPGDEVSEGALVIPHARKSGDPGDGKDGADTPPAGNRSPSMEAPTKGRK